MWATVPLAQLFAEERRCPRCGAALHDDRRVWDRRSLVRRTRVDGLSPDGERRVSDRRIGQRRRSAV
jgi:hypothetical protein